MKIFLCNFLLIFAYFTLGLVSSTPHARESTPDYKQITAAAVKQMRFADPISIGPSPFDGFYSMVNHSTSEISLISSDFKVIGFSARWQMLEENDEFVFILDSDEILRRRNEMFRRLNFQSMVVGPFGTGSRKVLVKSAPECPFCLRFDKDMMKLAAKLDLSFYIVPSSLVGPEEARMRIDAVACHADPKAVWRDSIADRPVERLRNCAQSDVTFLVSGLFFEKAIVSQGRLQIVGVGTPAFVFENGATFSGYLDEKWFEQEAKAALESPHQDW